LSEERTSELQQGTRSALRVKPTALIGFGFAIGYVPLFTILEKLMGVPYTELGKTSDSILRGIVIPLAIAAVVMAGLTTFLGWWRPVMREKPLGVKWMWAIPVIVGVLALAGVDYSQLGALSGTYIMWLAIGTLLVGFNEEIAYRGLALVAFRGAYKEVWVWLLTSLFFGLLHGANIILGQGVSDTIQQIAFAFVLGSIFYAVRRITGSLVVPMVFHALWDFGSFSHVGGLAATGTTSINLLVAIGRVPLLIALVVLFVVGAKRMFTTPVAAAN
jgi:uncharacterized protein